MNEMRKLMEAASKLNEAWVEYRDPDGLFQIVYEPPRGYFVIGKNDAGQDISGESFDNLDDAIDHAESILGFGYDRQQFHDTDRYGDPDLAEDYDEIPEGGDDIDYDYMELIDDLDLEDVHMEIINRIKRMPDEYQHRLAWDVIQSIANEFGIDVRS